MSQVDQETLRVMYPSMAESESAPAVPQAVAELRAAQDPRYDPTNFYDEQASRHALFDADVTTPPEAQRASVAELHRMAYDAGANKDDLGCILSEAGALKKNPPTDAQAAAMRTEASQLLVRTYGDDAAEALKDAMKLVARDPRWNAMLAQNNLGDSPRVVLKIAELARNERRKGRLK